MESYKPEPPPEPENKVLKLFPHKDIPIPQHHRKPSVRVELDSVDTSKITEALVRELYNSSLLDFYGSVGYPNIRQGPIISSYFPYTLKSGRDRPTREDSLLNDHGLVMEIVYRKLMKRLSARILFMIAKESHIIMNTVSSFRFNISDQAANKGSVLFVNVTLPSDLCPFTEQKITCPERMKYRRLNGTCNNPRNPNWGSINQPYRRLLFPEYEDGKH